MRDDDAMDRLLREAMAAEPPRLSPAFDARVMRRVRPRRLTPAGRAVMVVYALLAAAAMAWLLRDLPPEWIAGSAVAVVLIAVAAGAYARRLAFGS